MRLELGGWETLLALALLNLTALAEVHDHASKGGHEITLSIPLPTSPEACESKTINYITHTLPQQCLRTSWASSAASTDPHATESGHPTGSTPTASRLDNESSPDPPTEQKQDHEEKEGGSRADLQARDDAEVQEDLATDSFMSFEEWKEMMLRKSGQDPTDLKGRKHREQRGDRDPGVGNGDLDALGDDGEISLDFDALSDKVSELTASQPGGSPPGTAEAQEDQVFYDDGKTQYYRSKDAGKTCKERFSYSSFDAGATVLKTSPDAKNSKAILIENKDSYMLLECHTKNKFVIVELSDDILIDTVVLANFEFFSSMIRKFRVSVSARYPVKLDKWVELGTFDARNSRDIQPFLVEHPQIYTKYIRIEFLSHYGNEYYCPVSLLRVHGTRMIDSWKEPEGGRDDDDVEETIDSPAQEAAANTSHVIEPVVEPPQPSDTTEQIPQQADSVKEMRLSPWYPPFQFEPSRETCATGSPTTAQPTAESPVPVDAGTRMSTTTAQSTSNLSEATQTNGSPSTTKAATETTTPASSGSSDAASPTSSSPSSSAKVDADNATASDTSVKQQSVGTNASEPTTSAPTAKVTSQAHPTSKNKTSASSAQSASPTVQESFFKTVTKRLQLLESNTSLSLQYIEDQSRFLQEALQKMEKKQLSRVDAFLDNLNKTVLTELRNVRTQYDQIWQSTVIALESQREQSQRDVVALSSRLNVLADEVVFQKRMAILQSVLLLSCLVLVIFSRSYVGNSLELALQQQQQQQQQHQQQQHQHQHPGHHHHHNALADASSPSPAQSPDTHSRGGGGGPRHDKTLPLTPTSEYARSRGVTPSINVEEAEEEEEEGGEASFLEDVPELDDTPPRTTKGAHADARSESEAAHRARGALDQRHSSQGNGDVNSDGNGDRDGDGDGDGDGDPADVSTHTEPLRHSSSRSTFSQHGSARKPLPALPEDPPGDPS